MLGQPLLNFSQYDGPQYCHILRLWRNEETVAYRGLDARELPMEGVCVTFFHGQHDDKTLSSSSSSRPAIITFNIFRTKLAERNGARDEVRLSI